MQIYNLALAATAATFSASPPLKLDDAQGASFAIVTTGSDVAGTFTLEVSNDGTTWTTYAGSSQAITTSENVFYDVVQTQARYYRVVFAYSSGTGTITINVIKKQVSITGV